MAGGVSPAERAARHMLGPLDQPARAIEGVLADYCEPNRYSMLSFGERAATQCALAFWNGGGHATLRLILQLDAAGQQRFVEAFHMRTGYRSTV